MNGVGDIPQGVRMRAAEWLVELQADDLGEAERGRLLARLAAWRSDRPEHERAWQRVQAMGERLQPLAGTPASVALAQAARAGGAGRRRAVRQLALLLLVGGAAGTAAWQLGGEAGRTRWAVLGANVRTGTAERRRLPLADGTELWLNAGSAVDVVYSESARLVRLHEGEIHVETAHIAGSLWAARPFIVETRHGRVRALGTRFTVRQRADAPSRVAVFEGATEVTPRAGQAQALTLQAGQQSSFDALTVHPSTAADPTQEAWVRGVLVAHDMRLADFVSELDRYRPGWLVCDPAVADLRVSGTYPLNDVADTDRALDMLLATRPVQLRYRTRYWVRVEAAGAHAAP